MDKKRERGNINGIFFFHTRKHPMSITVPDSLSVAPHPTPANYPLFTPEGFVASRAISRFVLFMYENNREIARNLAAHGHTKFYQGNYSKQCEIKAECWHILQEAAQKWIGANQIMFMSLSSPSFTTR